jgi:hypothetical protein
MRESQQAPSCFLVSSLSHAGLYLNSLLPSYCWLQLRLFTEDGREEVPDLCQLAPLGRFVARITPQRQPLLLVTVALSCTPTRRVLLRPECTLEQLLQALGHTFRVMPGTAVRCRWSGMVLVPFLGYDSHTCGLLQVGPSHLTPRHPDLTHPHHSAPCVPVQLHLRTEAGEVVTAVEGIHPGDLLRVCRGASSSQAPATAAPGALVCGVPCSNLGLALPCFAYGVGYLVEGCFRAFVPCRC